MEQQPVEGQNTSLTHIHDKDRGGSAKHSSKMDLKIKNTQSKIWFLTNTRDSPIRQIAYFSDFTGIPRQKLLEETEDSDKYIDLKWTDTPQYVSRMYKSQNFQQKALIELRQQAKDSGIAKFLLKCIENDKNEIIQIAEIQYMQSAMLLVSIDYILNQNIPSAVKLLLAIINFRGCDFPVQELSFSPRVTAISLILGIVDCFPQELKKIEEVINKDVYIPGSKLIEFLRLYWTVKPKDQNEESVNLRHTLHPRRSVTSNLDGENVDGRQPVQHQATQPDNHNMSDAKIRDNHSKSEQFLVNPGFNNKGSTANIMINNSQNNNPSVEGQSDTRSLKRDDNQTANDSQLNEMISQKIPNSRPSVEQTIIIQQSFPMSIQEEIYNLDQSEKFRLQVKILSEILERYQSFSNRDSVVQVVITFQQLLKKLENNLLQEVVQKDGTAKDFDGGDIVHGLQERRETSFRISQQEIDEMLHSGSGGANGGGVVDGSSSMQGDDQQSFLKKSPQMQWQYLRQKMENGHKLSIREYDQWRNIAFKDNIQDALMVLAERSIIAEIDIPLAINCYEYLFLFGETLHAGLYHSLLIYDQNFELSDDVAWRSGSYLKRAHSQISMEKYSDAERILTENLLTKKEFAYRIMGSYYLACSRNSQRDQNLLGALTAFEILRRDSVEKDLNIRYRILILINLCEKNIYFANQQKALREMTKFASGLKKQNSGDKDFYEYITDLFIQRKVQKYKEKSNFSNIQGWQSQIEGFLHQKLREIFKTIKEILKEIEKEYSQAIQDIDKEQQPKKSDQQIQFYQFLIDWVKFIIYPVVKNYSDQYRESNQGNINIKIKETAGVYDQFVQPAPNWFFNLIVQPFSGEPPVEEFLEPQSDQNSLILSQGRNRSEKPERQLHNNQVIDQSMINQSNNLNMTNQMNKNNVSSSNITNNKKGSEDFDQDIRVTDAVVENQFAQQDERQQKEEILQALLSIQNKKDSPIQLIEGTLSKFPIQFEASDILITDELGNGHFTFNNQLFYSRDMGDFAIVKEFQNLSLCNSPFFLNCYGFSGQTIINEPILCFLQDFQSNRDLIYQTINPFDLVVSLIFMVNSIHVGSLDGAFALYGYESLVFTQKGLIQMQHLYNILNESIKINQQFLPPEIYLKDNKSQFSSSDTWALGSILYYLFWGRKITDELPDEQTQDQKQGTETKQKPSSENQTSQKNNQKSGSSENGSPNQGEGSQNSPQQIKEFKLENEPEKESKKVSDDSEQNQSQESPTQKGEETQKQENELKENDAEDQQQGEEEQEETELQLIAHMLNLKEQDEVDKRVEIKNATEESLYKIQELPDQLQAIIRSIIKKCIRFDPYARVTIDELFDDIKTQHSKKLFTLKSELFNNFSRINYLDSIASLYSLEFLPEEKKPQEEKQTEGKSENTLLSESQLPKQNEQDGQGDQQINNQSNVNNKQEEQVQIDPSQQQKQETENQKTTQIDPNSNYYYPTTGGVIVVPDSQNQDSQNTDSKQFQAGGISQIKKTDLSQEDQGVNKNANQNPNQTFQPTESAIQDKEFSRQNNNNISTNSNRQNTQLREQEKKSSSLKQLSNSISSKTNQNHLKQASIPLSSKQEENLNEETFILPGMGVIQYKEKRDLVYVTPTQNFVVWDSRPNLKTLKGCNITSVMKGSGTMFTRNQKIIQGQFSTFGIPTQAFIVDMYKNRKIYISFSPDSLNMEADTEKKFVENSQNKNEFLLNHSRILKFKETLAKLSGQKNNKHNSMVCDFFGNWVSADPGDEAMPTVGCNSGDCLVFCNSKVLLVQKQKVFQLDLSSFNYLFMELDDLEFKQKNLKDFFMLASSCPQSLIHFFQPIYYRGSLKKWDANQGTLHLQELTHIQVSRPLLDPFKPYQTRITYPNQDFYEGQIIRNQYNGQGKYGSQNKTIIEGQYRNNKVLRGKFFDMDEQVSFYDGQVRQNDVSLKYERHGQGLAHFKGQDEQIYKGSFVDNLFHGFGEIHSQNGKITYVGEFAFGQKSGHGEITNLIQQYNYTGGFLNDLKHGNGEENFFNGNYYSGEFFGGKRTGDGTLIEGSLKFDGKFLEGKKHGEGVETQINGGKMYQVKYYQDKQLWKKFCGVDAECVMIEENQRREQKLDEERIKQENQEKKYFAYVQQQK